MKQHDASAARTAQERFWVLRKGVVEFWHMDPGQARCHCRRSVVRRSNSVCFSTPVQQSQSIKTLNGLILTQRRNRKSRLILQILVCFPFSPLLLNTHSLLCLDQVNASEDSGVKSRPGQCHFFIDLQKDSYRSDEICFKR